MAILAAEAPIVLSIMLVTTHSSYLLSRGGGGLDNLQYTDEKDGDDAQSPAGRHVQRPNFGDWQRPNKTVHDEIAYSICLEELELRRTVLRNVSHGCPRPCRLSPTEKDGSESEAQSPDDNYCDHDSCNGIEGIFVRLADAEDLAVEEQDAELEAPEGKNSNEVEEILDL